MWPFTERNNSKDRVSAAERVEAYQELKNAEYESKLLSSRKYFEEELDKLWTWYCTTLDEDYLNYDIFQDKLSKELIQRFWNGLKKRPWENEKWYLQPESYIANVDYALDKNTLRQKCENLDDFGRSCYDPKSESQTYSWMYDNVQIAIAEISQKEEIPIFEIDERARQLRVDVEEIVRSRSEEKRKSRYIPREVQDRVWRRDEGKCVECGSNEFLEFDHIIPHSKGGANTYRNIQLLCEKCNRSKSDNIG